MLKKIKRNISLFPIAFVLATILLMAFSTGCGEDPLSTKPLSSDEQLLKSILDANNKQTVTEENLPAITKTILNDDYSESYVERVKLAPKLGYEVDLRMEDGVFVGELITKYFAIDGKEIRVAFKTKDKPRVEVDRNDQERNKCFLLELPVTFTMSDGSDITVAEKEDWSLIRSWYEANPDSKERPVLHYPVNVLFRDGTMLTVESAEEMREIYASCNDGKKDRKENKCFKFVLPITYTMPDESIITIEELEDWASLRDWYEANPDTKERPVLHYPVIVIFRDSTTLTVESAEEMREIYASCDDGKKDRKESKCFKFVLPIKYTMADGTLITIETPEDRGLLRSWHEANPDSKDRPTLQFPVDVTFKDGSTVTINNAEELKRVLAGCKDRKDGGRRDNP